MTFVRAIFAVSILLLAATQAQAACAPFPKSAYLGNYTHEQVAKYVRQAHGGDWTPYLVTLNRNLEHLEGLQQQNKGAVLKVSGKTRQVSPVEIAKYVYVSKQWLSVAQCLAEEQALASLNDFSTAAGSDAMPQQTAVSKVSTGADNGSTTGSRTLTVSQPQKKDTSLVKLDNTEVASLPGEDINVKITALCQSGVTVFRVVNAGGAWPDTGVFSMFRMDGLNRQVISARRMQLGEGEAKTFRISKKQNLTGEIGLAIEPSWYERTPQVDASAKCR